MARRFLILLPLCLLLRDRSIVTDDITDIASSEAVQIVPNQIVLKDDDQLREKLIAGIIFTTGQPFPGCVPWGPVHDIGSNGLYPLEALLVYNPVLFLEMCLKRYEREVHGYTAILIKQERVGGELQKLETVAVHFREQPFSVHMRWLEGGSGLMAPGTVLFVKGQNDDKLVARGRDFLSFAIVSEDIHGEKAKSTGRYTLDQFGISLGTQRTVASMLKAKERGNLHIAYEGPYKVPLLGDRICHKFVRTPYAPLEEDDLNKLTILIDKKTWLQVGSELWDNKGNLIAKYYFKDVHINPEFKKDQFTRDAL